MSGECDCLMQLGEEGVDSVLDRYAARGRECRGEWIWDRNLPIPRTRLLPFRRNSFGVIPIRLAGLLSAERSRESAREMD